MLHRTMTEITVLVLEIVKNSRRATQTAIKYNAFLSHANAKKYLSLLLNKGLIEYHKEEQIYKITGKGMHFLDVYKQIQVI
ncbi:MAG: winged helix-turn-helix domain-containing protein [Nitrososphaeraceae archaeon]